VDLLEAGAQPPAIRHPWEQARLAFFLRVLGEHRLADERSTILDVGAGDAWFASRLAEATGASVACWDTGYARALPRAPGSRLSFTADAPPGAFDLVLALDVVEHVEDDAAFVGAIVRDHLREAGHLLFSVPAWPRLFSGHDVRLGHVRRYSPRRARALLEGAGLAVIEAGGLFHSLLLPRALQKAAEPLVRTPAAHAGEWRGSRSTTAAARALLGLDARVSRTFARIGWDVPGLSWWALCRKA
jgi:SAM-dependent methyltransferase